MRSPRRPHTNSTTAARYHYCHHCHPLPPVITTATRYHPLSPLPPVTTRYHHCHPLPPVTTTATRYHHCHPLSPVTTTATRHHPSSPLPPSWSECWCCSCSVCRRAVRSPSISGTSSFRSAQVSWKCFDLSVGRFLFVSGRAWQLTSRHVALKDHA